MIHLLTLVRRNALIILLLGAVTATGGTLMFVSQKVYDRQNAVRDTSRDLMAAQWELRMLKAEWAYLTRPDRLEHLTAAASGASGGDPAVAPRAYRAETVSALLAPHADNIPAPLPSAKPRVYKASAQTVASTPPKTESGNGDFNSLLKTLGGAE